MRKKINPLYYFIPVLHVGLIALFLLLQFRPDLDSSNKPEAAQPEEVAVVEPVVTNPTSETRETVTDVTRSSSRRSKFRKEIGSMLVYSSKRANESNKSVKLSTAVVEQGGFSFLFENKNDVNLILSDGTTKRLSLQRVSFDANSISMTMNNDLVIRFQEQGSEIAISAIGKNIGRVEISLDERSKAKIIKEDGFPLISSIWKNSKYMLLHSSYKKQSLSLTVQPKGIASAFIKQIKKDASPVEVIKTVVKADRSYITLLQDWKDSAWKGWVSGRFNSQTGLWKLNNGSEGVSPDLVTVFTAEAYARNNPVTAINRISAEGFFRYNQDGVTYNDVEIDKRVLSFETSLLYGNLRSSYNSETAAVKKRLSKMSSAASSKDYGYFQDPRLADRVAFWGTTAQQTQFFSFVKNLDIRKLKAVDCSSFIINAVKATLLFPEQKNALTPAINAASEKLALSLVLDPKGAFLFDGNYLLPVETWKAGVALSSVKTISGNKYSNLSAVFLQSAVALSDSSGSLAHKVRTGDYRAIGQSSVFPEELYFWIPGQAYLPRVERFNSGKAKGLMVYHRAKSLKVRSESAEMLALDFNHWYNGASTYRSIGVVNSFLIKGLDSFSKAQIYGMDWNGAANYELYRVGYYYFENEKMATVMLRQKSTNETFRIFW